jgi:hypothetical protein
MIHYQLRCSGGHGFEGWFRDSDTFEKQAVAGEIGCPVCQDTNVDRAPMAPRVAKQPSEKPVPSPAAVREALRNLRRAVESNCEHVGDRFAEEARKIHYGETEARNIYGGTTMEEAAALSEEGISFGRIPWVPDTDA